MVCGKQHLARCSLLFSLVFPASCSFPMLFLQPALHLDSVFCDLTRQGMVLSLFVGFVLVVILNLVPLGRNASFYLAGHLILVENKSQAIRWPKLHNISNSAKVWLRFQQCIKIITWDIICFPFMCPRFQEIRGLVQHRTLDTARNGVLVESAQVMIAEQNLAFMDDMPLLVVHATGHSCICIVPVCFMDLRDHPYQTPTETCDHCVNLFKSFQPFHVPKEARRASTNGCRHLCPDREDSW